MRKLLFIFVVITKLCFADGLPHLFILHLNGINTTYKESKKNADALKTATPIKSNMMTFSYVWNPSRDEKTSSDILSLIKNLSDVANQKKIEWLTQLSLDDFTDAWMKYNPESSYSKGTPEYENVKRTLIPIYKSKLENLSGYNFDDIVNNFHNTVPEPFKSVTALLKTPYNQAQRYNEYNILNHNSDEEQQVAYTPQTEEEQEKMLLHYQQQTEQMNHDAMVRLGMVNQKNYKDTKNMVILVPHSQGNLYANSLYNYLTGVEHFPPNQIAIFGIASPAGKNAGDWMLNELNKANYNNKCGKLTSYITSSGDRVIDFVRLVTAMNYIGNVLPSNISGLSNELDPDAGHNLVNVYLKNDSSREQIVKMISLMSDYFISQLVFNRSAMKNFDLTMSGYHYGNVDFATFATLSNGNGDKICSGASCNANVLYLTVMDPKYTIYGFGETIFPHQSFIYDNYRISYVPKSGKGQMMLTFPETISIMNYQNDATGRVLPNSFITMFPPCKGPNNTCYNFSI